MKTCFKREGDELGVRVFNEAMRHLRIERIAFARRGTIYDHFMPQGNRLKPTI
jgi:hypothetical protein